MEKIEEMKPIGEAAHLLGVSSRTLVDMDKRGELECLRTPGGHRRIPVAELERIAQKMKDGSFIPRK